MGWYGVKYTITEDDGNEINFTSKFLNSLFPSPTLAQDYVDTYVFSGSWNESGESLDKAFRTLYPKARSIDWQIMQMIPADALSDAIAQLVE